MPCHGYSDAQLASVGLRATPDGHHAVYTAGGARVAMPQYMLARGHHPAPAGGAPAIPGGGAGGGGGAGAGGQLAHLAALPADAFNALTESLNALIVGPLVSLRRQLDRCASAAPRPLPARECRACRTPRQCCSHRAPTSLPIPLASLLICVSSPHMQPTLPASSSAAPRLRARSPNVLVASFMAIFALAAAIYHAPGRLAEIDRATERAADRFTLEKVAEQMLTSGGKVRVFEGAAGSASFWGRVEYDDDAALPFSASPPCVLPLAAFDGAPADGALNRSEASLAEVDTLPRRVAALPRDLRCEQPETSAKRCFRHAGADHVIAAGKEYEAWYACVLGELRPPRCHMALCNGARV